MIIGTGTKEQLLADIVNTVRKWFMIGFGAGYVIGGVFVFIACKWGGWV